MTDIRLEEGRSTPRIITDSKTGTLEISGKSFPEHAFRFFQPLKEWLHTFLNSNPQIFTLNFKLKYFNSTTSKIFFDIFNLLDHTDRTHLNITINWYYNHEDDVSEELGMDFKEDFKDLTINLIKIASNPTNAD